MWEKDFPGGMIGYTTWPGRTALAHQWMSPRPSDIPRGSRVGLSAMRTLHLEGYGDKAGLYSRLADATILTQARPTGSRTPVQDPMRFIQQKRAETEKPLAEGFLGPSCRII